MNKLFLILVLVFFSVDSCFAEQKQILSLESSKLSKKDIDNQGKASLPGHFSTNQWKKELSTKGAIDRHETFRRFLQDYNLIGMRHERVVELLGPENHVNGEGKSFYLLLSAPIDHGNNLCIDYDNNKVKQWQFEYLGKSGPWIQSNVLWTGSNGILGDDGAMHY